MRPRTSLLLAAVALVVVAWIAASAGSREARPGDSDLRRSTFLTGPAGARAWADALELLGVQVTRFRQRTTDLPPAAGSAVLAVLDPSVALSGMDGLRLAAWRASGGSVLAAGAGAAAYFRCFGLMVSPHYGAVAQLHGDSLPVNAVFAPVNDSGSNQGIGAAPKCAAGAYRADTLLALTDGKPVALRVRADTGGVSLLVADGGLFANRAVRRTAAGEFTLGLVHGSFSRVIVDEYHQGFGPGGGMARAARQWLVRAPAGWAILQLGIVGALALLFGAIRFGPARRVIERRRRSSLEHVHALATALAAAGGHEVAVSLVVRGLRRRLAHGAVQPGATGDWLLALPARARTAQGRAAAERLISITRGRADAHSVRAAAIAVEDVWQDLTP